MAEFQLRSTVLAAGVNRVTWQRGKQTSPKGAQAAMSCARYAKWPFHSGKTSAGTLMVKSVCGTSKSMRSIWRETRAGGGEMVRGLENIYDLVEKRLEASRLFIKSDEERHRNLFVEARRSCREEINELVCTHPMVKTQENCTKRGVKGY